MLKNATPGPSEYVKGLTLTEAATLLNIDANDNGEGGRRSGGWWVVVDGGGLVAAAIGKVVVR